MSAEASSFVGYIGPMFEVLVFVYENYWRGDACPEPQQLGRKLSAHGFDADEIREALQWLDGLNFATRGLQPGRRSEDDAAPLAREPAHPSSEGALRVYVTAEQERLGAEGLGFLRFLESAGALSAEMREIVIDRAMAAPSGPVSLDDLKIIVLMVCWSTGTEPDALVLDELCQSQHDRIAH